MRATVGRVRRVAASSAATAAASMRAEQPAMATGGTSVVDEAVGDGAEGVGGVARAERDGRAGVAAGGDGRLERDRAEERDAGLGGQRRAAALAEQGVGGRRARSGRRSCSR